MHAHVLTIAATLCAAGLLAGCAAQVAGPPPTVAASAPSASATASPAPVVTSTATPNPNVTIDPKALFTVTVTATLTGAVKAKVDLVEAVYGPYVTTPDSAGDAALLKKQHCAVSKGAKYLTAKITATPEAGSPAWPAKDNYLVVELGDNLEVAWSGDWEGFQSTCSSTVIKVPGSIHGVLALEHHNDVAGTNGWDWAKNDGAYGFDLAFESAPPYPVTFSYCAISLGSVAQADPTAQAWQAQAGTGPMQGYTCTVGDNGN